MDYGIQLGIIVKISVAELMMTQSIYPYRFHWALIYKSYVPDHFDFSQELTTLEILEKYRLS